jgi:hypothetical protein
VASLNAGADLILFGGGDTTGTRLTRRVLRTVNHAVDTGSLTRRTLIDAAQKDLKLKHVQLCSA